MIDKKRGCDAVLCACTHLEDLVHKDLCSYPSMRDHVNKTASIYNPPMYNTPRDPHYTALLPATEVNRNHMKGYFEGGSAEPTMKISGI